MNYSVIHMQWGPHEEWEEEVLCQDLADAGCDSFMEQDAYVPTDLLDPTRIDNVLGAYRWVESYRIEQLKEENYNATWEQEHPLWEVSLRGGTTIQIMPHSAFGAGYHETTTMMVESLQAMDLRGKTVMDNGCGTGILGLVARRLGAARVTMVDIDPMATANTYENMVLNGMNPEDFTILTQDHPAEGKYDIILSNIHRNILLDQMQRYAEGLNPGGYLLISGFMEEDKPMLTAGAERYGLRLISAHASGPWRQLIFQS